jgi:hypothetical protein
MIDGLAFAWVNRHLRASDYIRLTGRIAQSTTRDLARAVDAGWLASGGRRVVCTCSDLDFWRSQPFGEITSSAPLAGAECQGFWRPLHPSRRQRITRPEMLGVPRGRAQRRGCRELRAADTPIVPRRRATWARRLAAPGSDRHPPTDRQSIVTTSTGSEIPLRVNDCGCEAENLGNRPSTVVRLARIWPPPAAAAIRAAS